MASGFLKGWGEGHFGICLLPLGHLALLVGLFGFIVWLPVDASGAPGSCGALEAITGGTPRHVIWHQPFWAPLNAILGLSWAALGAPAAVSGPYWAG